MNSCRARFCHVLVDFLESVLKLIVSPFKLDKLLAITGVSLVGAPSFVDFTGSLKIDSKLIDGSLAFTNQVDVASYICGGLLIVASIFLYHKRENIDDTPEEHSSLIRAIENKNIQNQSSIQFWFNQIYKFNAGINEIEFLMAQNNPSSIIQDYKKGGNLVDFNGRFILKEGINLKSKGRWSLFFYFLFAFIALGLYVFFISQVGQLDGVLTFIILILTFLFGGLSYLAIGNHGAVCSAERLTK
ncbi:hypothetical protein [Aliivibrio fischeri]|uniref:Uncharacterized protein n=1 Tax=Aliivibrio fischeri TaxID=668 RepID=A0A844P5W7_ALIFS|nr:hypothetical protein [Aliivibrio fischeri]MUK51523.1 hypothetical protein [Aliivibrio fischeri]